MTKQFKPMLAHNQPYEMSDLVFPLYASAKLDGIRATVVDGQLVSRSLKLIPNKHIQYAFAELGLNGIDGELIIGSPTSAMAYRDSVSVVMSEDKPIDELSYFVFDDHTQPEAAFSERLWQLTTRVAARVASLGSTRIKVLEQVLVHNLEELEAFEAKCLAEGYEGVILRKPSSKYKFGRSTFKEAAALKLKRYAQDEAIIIGFSELMENQNVAFINELGNTAHTSHQENLVGKDTLGSLLVRDIKTNVEFYIGTGFSAEERQHIWDNIHLYMGELVTYSHFPIGGYSKPRFPSYKGLKNLMDMSE